MTTTYTAADLVLCTSADGWSLHAPGSTDEDIASGAAPCLVSGAGEKPSKADYERALVELAARRKRSTGYTISHYDRGNWIWDGNADKHGETTAHLPDQVYDAMPLPEGEDVREVTVDGVRYRIERA